MQSDKRSVLLTSRKNMPMCGRCRRNWAPWGCMFGSVRALCIEGKEIKGSEGMNRLIPGLERIPCLRWQEKGDAVPVVSFCACWGFPWRDLHWLWQEGWVAEGRTELSASSAGQEQKFYTLESPKQPSRPQDWLGLILTWIISESKPTPPSLNATFCCGGELNLPLGNWSGD